MDCVMAAALVHCAFEILHIISVVTNYCTRRYHLLLL